MAVLKICDHVCVDGWEHAAINCIIDIVGLKIKVVYYLKKRKRMLDCLTLSLPAYGGDIVGNGQRPLEFV